MDNLSVVIADTNSSGASELVPPTVYEVGWNSDYIIARQHNLGASKQERSANNYYIVHMISGDSVQAYSINNKLVIGPLDKDGFEKKRRELGIEGIEFSVKVKKNEPK